MDEIGLLIQAQVVQVTRLYHALFLCSVCHVSVFHEKFYETLHETAVASFFVVIPALHRKWRPSKLSKSPNPRNHGAQQNMSSLFWNLMEYVKDSGHNDFCHSMI